MRQSAALLLLIALAVPNAAVAQEEDKRRYDVEIIVFENLAPGAGEQEHWRPEVHVPEFHKVIEFDGGARGFLFHMDEDRIGEDEEIETPEGYRRLPAERMQLGDMVEKLQESDRYRVLRHMAWRQPADDRDRAIAVRVRSGEPMTVQIPIRDFEELYRLEKEAGEESPEADTGAGGIDTDTAQTLPAGDTDGEPATGTDIGGVRTFATGPMFGARLRPLMRPVEVRPLDGTVRVAVSRYLHVSTDLHLTTPVEWTTLSGREADVESRDDRSRAEGEEAAVDPAPTGMTARQQHPIGPDGRNMLSYPFQQNRRMRSGELHYLDHPVLGLLIRVDRAPEEEDAGSGVVE